MYLHSTLAVVAIRQDVPLQHISFMHRPESGITWSEPQSQSSPSSIRRLPHMLSPGKKQPLAIYNNIIILLWLTRQYSFSKHTKVLSPCPNDRDHLTNTPWGEVVIVWLATVSGKSWHDECSTYFGVGHGVMLSRMGEREREHCQFTKLPRSVQSVVCYM